MKDLQTTIYTAAAILAFFALYGVGTVAKAITSIFI